MKTKLKATLEAAIEKWMADNGETDEWPDCYFGSESTTLMAEAAAAVFNAVVEFQQYAKAEGFFDD